MVRFGVHSHQNERDTAVLCETEIVKEHNGHNADGEKERHYFIETTIQIGAN